MDIYLKGYPNPQSKSIPVPQLPAVAIKNPKALKAYMQWKKKQKVIDKNVSWSFVMSKDTQIEENNQNWKFQSDNEEDWVFAAQSMW